MSVSTRGNLQVVITDSVEGVFTATSTVGTTGVFSCNATNEGTQRTVTISGQFVSEGGVVTASGAISGAFTVATWTAQRIAAAGVHAFVGNYSGTYWGSEGGTWTLMINSNGYVTATALSPSVGTVALTGTVSPAGAGTLQGSGTGIGGPFTITWSGTFRLEGSAMVCSGVWSSTSGYAGSWSGNRAE